MPSWTNKGQAMKVLVCGDSFAVTDPQFPGLHWSEKLLEMDKNIEVNNMAIGGCSNTLITLQLMQGLKLNPNFVIFSFTNEYRYESDGNVNAVPYDLSYESMSSCLKRRYQVHTEQRSTLSDNLEKIKNYFLILFCLQMCKHNGINFSFSLGGFEYRQDYTEVLRSNFIDNNIPDYQQHELSLNLWYHGTKQVPKFHVENEEVHTLFANECFAHLNKNHA